MALDEKTKTLLPNKILLVDDDQEILNRVKNWLESYRINVVVANQWTTALYQFNNNMFDLALIEQDLEEMSGMVMVQKWLKHENLDKRKTPFLLSLSNNRNKGAEALIKEFQDVQTVAKPYSQPQLLSILSSAMDKKKKAQAIKSAYEKVVEPLLQKGLYKEAIEIAQSKFAALGVKGKLLTAGIYEAAGELPPAVTLYEELYQTDQSNMLYLNEIGRLQMKMGNLTAAQKAFEKADEAAPMNIARLQEMTELYLAQKEPYKSVDKYKQLMSLHPEDKDIKYGFYERLVQCGFDDVAKEFCRQTSTPTELIRYYNNKGVMYSKSGDFTRAIIEYTHASHLIPGAKDLYRILYNTALAHINLKNNDHLREAQALLTECVKLKPDFDKAKERLEMVNKHLVHPAPAN